MKVLASYNIKGGVGKTAAAVNISYLAAHQGWRTLVWDLDPQGAASFYFRIKSKVKSGVKGIINKKHDLSDIIKGTDFEDLDLIPADFSYRNMDLLLDDKKNSSQHLHKLLKPLSDDYDFIILDCPPSISLVSESVFYAADALLVPIIPTILSIRTLEQIIRFQKKKKLDNMKVSAFFSMVDRRKKLHKEIVDNPPLNETCFLKSEIPYASDVEQMGMHRAPLPSYAPKSRSAQAYSNLWDEVILRLK